MQASIDREFERIQYVYNTYGQNEAISFAKQGIHVYRKALAQRNAIGKRYGYGLAYRKKLVGSCIAYRRYLYSLGVKNIYDFIFGE